MKRLLTVLAFLFGILIAPVAAQQVVRIFGTQSGGTITAALVDSTGRLLVSVAGGTITPTAVTVDASTCAAPGIRTLGALTTGIATAVTPSVSIAVAGNCVLTATATALTGVVPYLGPDGTAAAPSYSFTSEPGSGWYRNTTNDVRLSIAGTDVARALATAFTLSAGSALLWGSAGVTGQDVSLSRGAANVLMLASGNKFAFGGVTSSEALLKQNGAGISLRTGNDGGFATMTAGSYTVNGFTLISGTSPSVSSAGTSPSVAVTTGTAAFRVNVGTGGTATTIVMTMPAATTGWNCHAENLTATAANRANQRVVQQSSTTTAVTVQNQTISTGAALAFTASDIVAFMCLAY